jgi:hypothetical protein
MAVHQVADWAPVTESAQLTFLWLRLVFAGANHVVPEAAQQGDAYVSLLERADVVAAVAAHQHVVAVARLPWFTHTPASLSDTSYIHTV